MSGDGDARHMALALALGRRGQGQTWPNPAVGCVIVAAGRIVGRGWTAPGGRPHAETLALAQAGTAVRGATAYVTLEPCAHHGATPPCAEALARAGIARVVAPLTDSDPRVSGRGFAMLRAAGIRVETGVMQDVAAQDHAGFFLRIASGRPRVTLKLATSLDGRIATAAGESRWITGAAARLHVHAARARHDAVMVGGGTARADDPELTVRGLGARRQPVRIVLSGPLDLPADGRLARSAREVPLWLVHSDSAPPARLDAWRAAGATLIAVPAPDGRPDPGAALRALGRAGLTRLYCEGGGTLAAALLAADLVDELHLYTAGLALGAGGTPALGLLPPGPLAAAPRFRLAGMRPIGGDSFQTWLRT